jgi:hypothetical protein
MPFAFTAASSLFMVSCGPWLLLMVVNPCAAIFALHRYPAAVEPKEYWPRAANANELFVISARPGSHHRDVFCR